jgi:hypothetical protein
LSKNDSRRRFAGNETAAWNADRAQPGVRLAVHRFQPRPQISTPRPHISRRALVEICEKPRKSLHRFQPRPQISLIPPCSARGTAPTRQSREARGNAPGTSMPNATRPIALISFATLRDSLAPVLVHDPTPPRHACSSCRSAPRDTKRPHTTIPHSEFPYCIIRPALHFVNRNLRIPTRSCTE